MTVMATMPVSRPLTIEDFEAIRDAADDGHRYELVDGSLVVTPSPSWSHQVVSIQLIRVLLGSNPEPDRLVVLHAPLDVQLAEDSVVQPDLMVFDTDDEQPRRPLLAVEILSPSTRHIDIGLKWSRYAAAGIQHYWVVDPDEPSVTGWTLQDGTYREERRAVGDEQVELTGPWPVTLSPAALLRGVRPGEVSSGDA